MRKGLGAVAVLLLFAGCAPADTQRTAPDAPTAEPGKGKKDKKGKGQNLDDEAGDLADMAEDLAGEGGDEGEGPSGTGPGGAVIGADISWPQCPAGMGIPEKRSQGMPMPYDSAAFVVLGLTNGPGFTPNPCLAAQVDWVEERRLMAAAYSVLSYPDPQTLEQYGADGPYSLDDETNRLRNVGYAQARFNLSTMSDAGLRSPIIWLDVEPVPLFEWSRDPVANSAVVEGAARGYRDAGYEIGVYSTPSLWSGVVGRYSLGGVPEWRAAGQTSQEEALNRCGADWMIQGGTGVLGQWVADSRDHNITCPGVEADLSRWFFQY